MTTLPAQTSVAASDRLVGRICRLLRTHPHAAGSLAMHGLAVAVLLQLPPPEQAAPSAATAAAAARAERQIAQTQAREMQHRVERMEAIARLLGDSAGAAGVAPLPPNGAGGASPAALAARAQALSTAIDSAHRQLRAATLARMTGQPLPDALRELASRDAAERPALAAATPAATIALLERRATEALAAQRSRLEAQRQGVAVEVNAAASPAARASTATASTEQARVADGIPRSAAEQLAAMARLAQPQGRVGVPGEAGGRSVNPPGARTAVDGRIARADDRSAAALLGKRPPFSVTGSSFDLTRNTANNRADDAPYVQPPRAERATLRTAGGRVLGPGGSFAERVYLDSWYVIGPFEPHGEQTMETSYPPEALVDLDGAYRGKAGRTLQWQYASRGFYPFVPPDAEERAVYFAYTELRVDEDRDVWLSIAADDDSMLWLDERLVWKSETEDKPWYHPPFYLPDEQVASLALAEGHRRVRLSRGEHRLLLKLFNRRDRTFFSVVLAP